MSWREIKNLLHFALILVLTLFAIPTCWIVFREFTSASAAVVNRQRLLLPDFAQLSAYRSADEKIQCKGKCVVFIGDSITQYWKLGAFFPGQMFINRGIAGQTSDQVLLRFRQDVVDLGPQLVVVQCGINDLNLDASQLTRKRIQNNIASMIDLAMANGVHPVVATIMPINPHAAHRSRGVDQIDSSGIPALNEWIRAYCREKNLPCVDYYAAVADRQGTLRFDYSDDGIHPNPAGYSAMTAALLPVLNSQMH